MSTSGRKFSRNEIYDTIQATVACIQTTSRLWVLKTEDTNGGLYFDMVPKLDLAKYEVNLVELGGEPVKLINLIDRAVTKGLILYRNINFLPYPLNTPAYNTKFFNLFIGFLAKPAPEINKEIMDPILWHVKNVICSGDERLNEYIWNWWAYLVQKPENKPRTILVLKSTLQQCGKNIITDFIARKLIVMNETGMSNGEWHRFNGHLKSLITERMVAIERKGLETIRINDYAGYMVTSNQDAPLKIDIEDSRIVCFDVSACCRGNIPYFDRLGEILDHPDAPGVIETMRRQLPNPIRFIIDYILPWPENCINRFSCKKVYQDYLEWCECNGEKPLAKKDAGTKFSLISIDQTRSRDNGVRVYQYIFDRPKIVAKLRESGLGDMEEFSDISQDDLPENEITDIPIFNVPKTVLERPTIPQKITPPQPEENLPPRGKKADKQDDSTQVLFNYVAEQAEPLGASTSRTSETSKPPEPVIDKPEVNKLSKTNEPISKNTNMPPKETTSKLPDSSKPINEVSSAILLSKP
ncbi:highly derived D5-like helicase-primase [Rhizophagus irregularis DAOM 181602=DAOM 197198]|nr:highly derived D5-like helicase-primase [Rhizophagus irregularis DAOM 181602=DAOM 197198]